MSKAAELAALIGSQTALSNRNLLINGAQQVWQRGTSRSLGTSEGFISDRWKYVENNVDEFAFTATQSTTVPTGSGFTSSIKIDVTTAESSVASNEWAMVQQDIEAQNLQHLKYGTSSAESITLSFWVRSNVTGTYGVSIYSNDNTAQVISSTYTINAADTFEYKTITFPGRTAGAINNDNGGGKKVIWWLFAGSDYTSTDSTSWVNFSNAAYAFGHNVNVGSSASNEWYITGCQLEVGEQATPFEHRSFGDELARCQRYFYKTASADGFIGIRLQNSENRVAFPLTPQTMRAAPTITAFDTSGNSGELTEFSSNTDRAVSVTSPSVDGGGYAQISAGGTNWGNAVRMLFQMDAEL